MRLHHLAAACVVGIAALAATPVATAATDTLVINFNNLYSTDIKGSADNTLLTHTLAPGAYLTGVSWVVQMTAFDPSWLSEMTLELTNSLGEGVQLSPAGDLNAAGTLGISGQIDLVNTGLAFRLASDGQLQLELFDAVDDLAGQPDGRWLSGLLRIDYTAPAPVPEPASATLLLAGLTGVLAVRRRQRSAAQGCTSLGCSSASLG